jgi:hypothetical protein
MVQGGFLKYIILSRKLQEKTPKMYMGKKNVVPHILDLSTQDA